VLRLERGRDALTRPCAALRGDLSRSAGEVNERPASPLLATLRGGRVAEDLGT
jgi:hypothetical protein